LDSDIFRVLGSPLFRFFLSFSASYFFLLSMFTSAVVLVIYPLTFSLFLSEFFYCVPEVIFLSHCRHYVLNCFVYSYLLVCLRILLTNAVLEHLIAKWIC